MQVDIRDSVPGSGRSPGGGNENPLQYCCLENPMDRAAWWAIVHGVTMGRTQLSNFFTSIHYKLAPLKNFPQLHSFSMLSVFY